VKRTGSIYERITYVALMVRKSDRGITFGETGNALKVINTKLFHLSEDYVTIGKAACWS
jgi:hypothetical protein